MTTRRCKPVLALAAVLVVAAACTAAPDANLTAPSPEGAPGAVAAPVVTPTLVPTSVAAAPPVSPPTTLAPPPAGLVETIGARVSDARFQGSTVGLSVWLDGVGEIVAHNADVPLRPGSNEKILTAMGALAILGPETCLVTEVKTSAEQDGHVLRGDLVLVGGGDPTLTSRGPYSLDVLAAQIRDRGIQEVAGDLVGDESRFDNRRSAPGWADFHVPRHVGPLSALAVDGNQWRTDAEYVADPALGNVGAFREALARAGVHVTGGDREDSVPRNSRALASVSSAPIGSLVAHTLNTSNNFAAELLVKEVGRRVTGRGSSADGLSAAEAAMARLGVHLSGRSADGSGLSREDSRPAREWRELLTAARLQPWAGIFVDGLPLAGRSGTLMSRFRGTPAEGAVRAKTGSVRESRALSGYLTTAGGRTGVFALVVNGPQASMTLGAMDDLVTAMVASPA